MMNNIQQDMKRRGLSRISAKTWLPLALLVCLALVPDIRGFLDNEPKEYYFQPKHKEYLSILSRHDSLLSDIITQRGLLIWGQETSPYFENFGETAYDGFYQRDSVFIQRRACWQSSLFAKDLDFIEISLYTVDGIYSLRETYAINREDQRWAVVDSAGFPLFERVVAVSSDNTNSKAELGKFLLTLLSFAGYGSYDILGTVDTTYHEIDLAEIITDQFYPYRVETVADTTIARFTTSLRNGVEVSKWTISYFPDGILIDENEQLITYLDMPQAEAPDSALETEDTSAISGLLSDVDGETPAPDSGDTDRPPRPGAGNITGVPGGDIRLADLIKGNRLQPSVDGGSVSYEILSYKLAVVLKDTVIESGPEFVIFSEPQYPPSALVGNIPGVVEMMVKVDSTGRSRQAMVVKKSGTNYGFETTSRRSAAMCTFRPGRAAGKAVDMWLTYRITFSPEKKPQAPVQTSAQRISTDTAVVDSIIDSLADSTSDTIASSPLDSLLPDTIISDTLLDSVLNTLLDTLADTPSDTLSDTTRDSAADTLQDTLRDTLAGSLLDTLSDTLADTLSDTTPTPPDSASGDN